MKGVLDAAVNELDQHFDEVLQAARLTAGGALGGHAEHQDEDQAQYNGPAQGIHVERPETHFFSLFCGVGKAPVTRWQLPESQVLQVVLDVARSGLFCHGCLKRPKVSKILFSSTAARTS